MIVKRDIAITKRKSDGSLLRVIASLEISGVYWIKKGLFDSSREQMMTCTDSVASIVRISFHP